MTRFFLLLLLFFFQGITGNPQPDSSRQQLKLLFIGNSLTYTNDLPGMVKSIAELDGKNIHVQTIALPNYSLEDHWNEGNAAAAIENDSYDFVIMQQGPSAMPESQSLLLQYARKFSELCKEKKAVPVLFTVWPSRSRSFDHDNVISSYANAARQTGSLLSPAGLAWKKAWAINPSMALYGPDQFHPGLDGSLLSAMTIYITITGKRNLDFLELAATPWGTVLTKDQLQALKQAALASLEKQ